MRVSELFEDDFWGDREQQDDGDDTAELERFVNEWVDGEFGIPPGYSDVRHSGTIIVVGINRYKFDHHRSSIMRDEWVQTGEDLIDVLINQFGEWVVVSAAPFSVTLERR